MNFLICYQSKVEPKAKLFLKIHMKDEKDVSDFSCLKLFSHFDLQFDLKAKLRAFDPSKYIFFFYYYFYEKNIKNARDLFQYLIFEFRLLKLYLTFYVTPTRSFKLAKLLFLHVHIQKIIILMTKKSESSQILLLILLIHSAHWQRAGILSFFWYFFLTILLPFLAGPLRPPPSGLMAKGTSFFFSF